MTLFFATQDAYIANPKSETYFHRRSNGRFHPSALPSEAACTNEQTHEECRAGFHHGALFSPFYAFTRYSDVLAGISFVGSPEARARAEKRADYPTLSILPLLARVYIFQHLINRFIYLCANYSM